MRSDFAYIVKIGDIFGYLEILDIPYMKNNHSYVKCKCHCGNIVEIRKDHLFRKGHPTISCGCANKSAGEIKLE